MRATRRVIVMLSLWLPMFCMGQSRVAFEGIQLGLDYKTFTKGLKDRGFVVYIERKGEDDSFYGVCKEGFFVGKVDGNAAVVRVQASHKTGTVFSVEVNLREFIDETEALEEAKRLIPDEIARVPMYEVETSEMYYPDFIEMPGGKNHITKYMCYPVGDLLLLRFYESRQKIAEKNWYGLADFGIYQNSLGHEYILHIRYYDSDAGRIAKEESGKDNS